MSGSGGGRSDGYTGVPAPAPPTPKPMPGGGGGGGGGDGSDACDIVQIAPLNSPQPAVIATLSVNDVLDVELVSQGARTVLQVRAPAGVAGSLTHRGHIAIIQCIQAGHAYIAIVTRLTGGNVEVRIERA